MVMVTEEEFKLRLTIYHTLYQERWGVRYEELDDDGFLMQIYTLKDLDFNLVAPDGFTNKERMRKRLAPYDKDGTLTGMYHISATMIVQLSEKMLEEVKTFDYQKYRHLVPTIIAEEDEEFKNMTDEEWDYLTRNEIKIKYNALEKFA